MSKMSGKQLAVFAFEKIGTPYVYGMKGKVMSEANFNYLSNLYGLRYVPYTDYKKIGQVCVDCSGLIGWACGLYVNSATWHSYAKKAGHVYSIGSLTKAPVGALVWCEGHIGIYIGKENGVLTYIAADGSKYGVRKAPISANRFTHWLLVPDVFDYEWEDEEMVEKDTIIVNGKKHEVEMIRKDGTTYLKTRDIASVLGLKVSSKGKTPVLETT